MFIVIKERYLYRNDVKMNMYIYIYIYIYKRNMFTCDFMKIHIEMCDLLLVVWWLSWISLLLLIYAKMWKNSTLFSSFYKNT